MAARARALAAVRAARLAGPAAAAATSRPLAGFATPSRSFSSSAPSSGPLSPLTRWAESMLRRPAPAYATHVPLTPLEQSLVALGSSLIALRAPWRGDMVAAVGETTRGAALEPLLERMRSSAEGRRLLAERPRVTEATLERARRSPPGTFGAAYAHFMSSRRFSPDDRPAVRFVSDPELAYVIARMREIHDYWHTLFGCDTDVFGETALKAMEYTNTGVPMPGLAVLAGTTRVRGDVRRELLDTYVPWGLRAGAAAGDLIAVEYEKRFDQPIEELRRELGVVTAPRGHRNKFVGL